LTSKRPAKALGVAASTPHRDRISGLIESSRRRGEESRDLLRSAAIELFCSKGYHAVSVDDIASAAGVSRVTFYRHFRSRADLLGDIFERAGAAAMPYLTRIRDHDFNDPTVVRDWLAEVFQQDRSNRQMLQVFSQALKIDKEFLEGAQKLLFELIEELGRKIPAFAVDPDGGPGQRRRWLEAWLLLYDILDQSNQAALDVGAASDPLMLDILADRFVGFVERYG
jgi:AcrR family transcriptional regulator